MNAQDLTVFIDGAVHYFKQITGDAADVGTPYLMNTRAAAAKGITGIIGVTGDKRGNVFFTAPQVLVKDLLTSIGEEETTHDLMCDVVGEVANTISGNARKVFGKEFLISAPVVVTGQSEKIVVPSDVRSYVVPIAWRGFEAGLVISLC
ncbi:MAG: chemotaxis protein CheX [Gammaproteobacteria bacterium]